jgi:lactate dehydrogenase-like 2-hydroxyacid dehydrogenase
MKHRIVFLERESIRGTFRQPDFPHDYDEYPLSAAEDVTARVREASIVITNKVVLRGELLATLPKLKMIACAATGTDNVDLAWCREHGIVVSNIRGYAVNTVPEHVIALAMALRRNLLAYRRDVRAGQWQRSATSASSTIRSATCTAPPSASSAAARSARAWRGWPRPSACGCCGPSARDAEKVGPGRTAFAECCASRTWSRCTAR